MSGTGTNLSFGSFKSGCRLLLYPPTWIPTLDFLLTACWTGTIGRKKVVIFKSDSHMSQDTKTALKVGETLPNEDLWRQIIEDVQPSLVLTTGTAGGIGPDCEVGDVVVSPIGTVDC